MSRSLAILLGWEVGQVRSNIDLLISVAMLAFLSGALAVDADTVCLVVLMGRV